MEIDQSLGLKRDTVFDAVVLYIATALFTLTIVLTVAQVTVRVFDLGTLHWTEPVARFILIVGTFFGAAVATRNHEHIKINLLLDKLTQDRPVLRLVLDSIVGIIVVLFVLIAVRSTAGAAMNNWNTSIGGTRVITSGMIYLGITVGLGLMLVYEVVNLSESLRGLIGDESRRSATRGD